MRVAVAGSPNLAHLLPGTYDESYELSDSDHRASPNISSYFSASNLRTEPETLGSMLGTPPSSSGGAVHTENPAAKLSEDLHRSAARPVLPEIGKFEIEQHYEGVVLARDDAADCFTARLRDQRSNGPEEEAEFALSELPDDAHLIMPGAMFTWVVGLQWKSGQSKRVSEVRFRRLPPFTKNAIAEARIRAEQRAKMFATFTDSSGFVSIP